jgi:hypothetical protein
MHTRIEDLDIGVEGQTVVARWWDRMLGYRHVVVYGYEAGHLVAMSAATHKYGPQGWAEVWRSEWPFLDRSGWQTPEAVDKRARVMAQRELRRPEVIEREGPRA